MTGALNGLRVIDLSRVVAGPLCTRMLADHGATVIKVEPPAGDELRTYGPPFGEDTSGYFDGINRGKRHICLDLSRSAGRAVLRRLLADADVVVENFKAGTMDRWGLGYERSLVHDHPGLVYCRITGFGTDGPLGGAPGYDALLQAFSGLMTLSGGPDEPPVRIGVPVVDLTAGMLAFSGILLALHERTLSGRGQMVDMTLLDAALSLLHPHAQNWLAHGTAPKRLGDAHAQAAPYQTFQTRTGPVLLAANNNRQFAALVSRLGRPDLAEDPRFASNGERVAHRTQLAEILAGLVADADRASLADDLIRAGVPAAPVNTLPEALAEAQVHHRGLVIGTGRRRELGVPIALSRTPGRAHTPPGLRGADTADVLADLGYSAAQTAELLRDGAAYQRTDPQEGTTSS
ncbi:CoA transferase [Actinomadura chokoriensis]|uniref:CaiB/BaiF CoA transferase family protein n=1 Tax=Actinomadura chokoriensis TaxID=454156 RepID=UPI0031F8CDCB